MKNQIILVSQELEDAIAFQRRNQFRKYFRANGPWRRELYQKHMTFFNAGAEFKERLFMAANRVGKSDAGAYEVTCHLTGNYPDWWRGRRFDHPVQVWACGTSSETTRDIVQTKLLGKLGALGTGMIPGDLLIRTTPRKSGISGSIETAWIKHATGGESVIGLKSYEQGRKSFEGTAKHVIWCDEEPPADCYTEMLVRTATTEGILLITFTPIQGMSEVVKGFVQPENPQSAKSKWFVQASWDDVPHIPEEEKNKIRATMQPYQIRARTLGEPSMGAGAIYQIGENQIRCNLFAIPEHWPRVYGMDVGWNRTAVIWAAQDLESGVIYLYDEHYEAQGEPAAHARAVRARGERIRGVIDPSCLQSAQSDGRTLMDMYRSHGLNLSPAINAIEAGIQKVWDLLVGGRLKVMPNCENWFNEFRNYHRNENGKIVKREDHLMDATRYLIVSGLRLMRYEPPAAPSLDLSPNFAKYGNQGWQLT